MTSPVAAASEVVVDVVAGFPGSLAAVAVTWSSSFRSGARSTRSSTASGFEEAAAAAARSRFLSSSSLVWVHLVSITEEPWWSVEAAAKAAEVVNAEGIRATVAEATAPGVAVKVTQVTGCTMGPEFPASVIMATEAAATDVRREAAECWWVGGLCCLTGVTSDEVGPGSNSLSVVPAAALEAARAGFFLRLRFLVRLEATWW